MSNSGLSSGAQLRYMIQWFQEFSELQREDFLPILVASHGEKSEELAGCLAALTCQDKPLSLFQCRIKLFNEWYPTWSEEDKERLQKSVSEIDPEFGSKLQDALVNGIKVNGVDDFYSVIENHNHELGNNEENLSVDNTETVGISQEVSVEIAAAS
ncbi:uncharacterized protein C14orf119 isoform X2 [Leptidea sinapis]|nr:uncharacterized protein C14orf119 isoform X2 [Leptidea sinapis]